jgi:hypothetical protein
MKDLAAMTAVQRLGKHSKVTTFCHRPNGESPLTEEKIGVPAEGCQAFDGVRSTESARKMSAKNKVE